MRIGLALIAFALVTPASAQAPLLEDDAGDVMLTTYGTDVAAVPGELADSADLRSLRIDETPEELRFTVGLESTETGAGYATSFEVFFTFQGDVYRVYVGSSVLIVGDWLWWLYKQDADMEHLLLTGGSDVDAAAATVTFALPRDAMIDVHGGTPRPGADIEGIHVVSDKNTIALDLTGDMGMAHEWQDRMGHDAPATFPITLGVEQAGSLRLGSETPYRFSNGEAASFVYDVRLINLGDEDDVVRLAATGVPRGWDVTLPTPIVRIDGGATQSIPVVVHTAFAHAHGEAATFLLEATSDNDRGTGRLEMGIRYPAIAQPAGHHDTLWFHSRDMSGDSFGLFNYALNEALLGAGSLQRLTMNTEQDDPLDEGLTADSMRCGFVVSQSVPTTTYCWIIDLSPGLLMGLDFDTGRNGSVAVTVETTIPIEARLGGELRLRVPAADGNGFGEDVVLATIEGTSLDLGAGAINDFEGVLVPTADADLVPYLRGAGLRLDLELVTDNVSPILGPEPARPRLLPGGSMTLPLLEYEDPIDEVFGTGGLLRLEARQQEAFVNPGETVLLASELHNEGVEDGAYTLRTIGDDGWASLPEGPRVNVPAGGSVGVPLAVAAPAAAQHGDRIDFILEAGNDDSIERALVRLVVHVDAENDLPDASEQAAGLGAKEKESPAASTFAMSLALVIASVLARRR